MFAYAKPTVTLLSPNAGPPAGGTSVTVTGTNFVAGATVKFGAVSGTSVVVLSATSLTVVTPAQSPGGVTVTVTNPDGTSTSAVTFTYQATPTKS